MRSGFDFVFNPRSIAVVGASNTAGTVGKAVMDNIRQAQFKGALFPVNTKPVHFSGLKSFPSISAIGEAIDLAVIMVPAVHVPEVMQQAADAGTKAVVIISAGFKETGEAGAALEKEIARIATYHGMHVVGPNCIGVLNPHESLNASFAGTAAPKGSVAVVSQSGALGTALLDLANEYSIGFSKFITTGNKALFDELELLQYLAQDPETKVVAMYVESLSPRSDWVLELRRLSSIGPRPLPIVVLKAGTTKAGALASESHTGSLAGDEATYKAFFRQAGLVEVGSIEEMLLYADALVHNPIPSKDGVAIVTNAGGPGILATDASEAAHLPLSNLSESTMTELRVLLPAAASIHNPIDVLGDADAKRYEKALNTLAHDDSVGSVVALVTPQAMTDIGAVAGALVKIRQTHAHLALAAAMIGGPLLKEGTRILREAGIAVSHFPEQAIGMVHALHSVASARRNTNHHYPRFSVDADKADQAIVKALHRNAESLLLPEVETVLKAYNIAHATSKMARTPVEAVQIAHALGKPVALKVVAPEVIHKTEVGGVKTGVMPNQVSAAYEEIIKSVRHHMPTAHIEGILVQEMVPLENELIIGAKRDPVFGPVVLVGLGGVYVEVLKDTALRVAPVSNEEALQMIEELRSAPLLHGSRGQAPLDIKAVQETILKISELMMRHPEISELDLNPLVVGQTGKGIEVLDARFLLH